MNRLFRDRVQLLVCDSQEKFAPLMYGREGFLEATSMMVRAAKVYGIPTIISEHTKEIFG